METGEMNKKNAECTTSGFARAWVYVRPNAKPPDVVRNR